MQPFRGAAFLTTVVVMRVILKLTKVEVPEGLDSDRDNVQRPLEAWPDDRDFTGVFSLSDCQLTVTFPCDGDQTSSNSSPGCVSDHINFTRCLPRDSQLESGLQHHGHDDRVTTPRSNGCLSQTLTFV